MERRTLTRKQRTFVLAKENAKELIAFENTKLYAVTDIPIPLKTKAKPGTKLIPPKEIWAGYDPRSERLDGARLSCEGNLSVYTYCAAHLSDGSLTVKLSCYAPSFDSPKAILLIGENVRLPQPRLIESLVKHGFYVFTADYNGLSGDGITDFPDSVYFGKRGDEGQHLNRLAPTAKETCAYVYTLIHRRAVTFINEQFKKKDIIVLGIRTGVEIAMRVAGLEKKRVSALCCICGAGYPEYVDSPKFPGGLGKLNDDDLSYVVSMSGVSYLKDYPNPVFVAVGSNGTMSDVDRLDTLKKLIKGQFSLSVSQKYSDNIDVRAWGNCLSWLDYTFWKSDFPSSPETSIDVKRDGAVYAGITASPYPRVKELRFYYSYNNYDHKSRQWEEVACETVGKGQYLAKLEFSKDCSGLFFYTETTYLNGAIATEPPKYTDLSSKRLLLTPQKTHAILFRHGAEGEFIPVSDYAVISQNPLIENVLPSGAKGTVCPIGSMKVFLGDACMGVGQRRLLQADVYCKEPFTPVELMVTFGRAGTLYRAVKHVNSGPTFVSVELACTDFKDELFRPMPSWAGVSSITVVTPNVTVNKLTFV